MRGNKFYLLIMLVEAWLLLRAIQYLIQITEKKWKRLLLLISSAGLLAMVIFIGDKINVLFTAILFLGAVWLTCEGSFWKRMEIGLLFSSTILAFNALRDNYFLNVMYIHFHQDYYMIRKIILSGLFTGFLYLGIRKFAPDKNYTLSDSTWRLLLLLTATPFCIMLSIITLYNVEQHHTMLIKVHQEFAVVLFLVLMSFIGVFWAIIVLAKQQKLEQQNTLAEINRNYYQLMEQQHIEIRQIKHDMANHLSILAALPQEQREDYIKDLTERVIKIHTLHYCGDATINAVLSVKESIINRNEMQWEIQMDIAKELPFEKVDICALFANAIDNAVEACVKQTKDRRKSVLKCKAQKGLFCMSVTNPVPPFDEESLQKESFATTKPDKENHGFGLKTMQEIVERYHGELELKTKDGIFELFLYMPLETVIK